MLQPPHETVVPTLLEAFPSTTKTVPWPSLISRVCRVPVFPRHSSMPYSKKKPNRPTLPITRILSRKLDVHNPAHLALEEGVRDVQQHDREVVLRGNRLQ